MPSSREPWWLPTPSSIPTAPGGGQAVDAGDIETDMPSSQLHRPSAVGGCRDAEDVRAWCLGVVQLRQDHFNAIATANSNCGGELDFRSGSADMAPAIGHVRRRRRSEVLYRPDEARRLGEGTHRCVHIESPQYPPAQESLGRW